MGKHSQELVGLTIPRARLVVVQPRSPQQKAIRKLLTTTERACLSWADMGPTFDELGIDLVPLRLRSARVGATGGLKLVIHRYPHDR
jgi:hypothetical protein